jgi:uncharacterized heparinase superfamily protein
MPSIVTQTKKLRGKSLKEIRVRGRQEFRKLNEQFLGSGCAEMSDQKLLRQISPASRNGNGEGSAMLILERIRSSLSKRSSATQSFFPSLACRDEVSAIIKERFASERHTLLQRAERAIRGRFDLLGFNNLSFGEPIDWHLDPTTGKRTPLVHWSKIDYLDPSVAGDKKVTWELNRHAHFVTLGQAYWLTGDERFAEAFVEQASSWMDANPPKLGINWASSLELSFRVIAWLWALHLFADSDRLTPKFASRFLKYLVAQGRHIESYLSHYFSPNTHLTGEALGLFYLGVTLPELARSPRWRDAGLGVLLEQLPRHIRRDGVYFEQSSYYQRYTSDFYTHLIVLARAANLKLPPEVEERLSLALDHLMWISRPDGTSPFYGDDDGGRLITLNVREADDFRDTLAVGSALLRRSDWKFVAGLAPIETLWLLGPGALERYDQIETKPPTETSHAFVEGGCFVMRDGWSKQSSYALVDCGPHGSSSCGHAHADALAFEYAAEGKTWLVDPGTFTYTGDVSLREYFRTTKAHNTVTVDGQPQSVAAGAFGWKHIARSNAKEFIVEDTFDYFEGSHDGYERLDDPVTHNRSLLFLKQSAACEIPPLLIVRDRFNALDNHRYALRYHLEPGCSMIARNNTAEAFETSGRALSISVFGQSDARMRIEDGWVSRCYGRRESTPVALFEAEGKGRQEFVSVIASFTSHGYAPATDETPVTRQDVVLMEDRPYKAYSISAGELRDLVLMGASANQLQYEQLTAAAETAWARFAGGDFISGCLIHGQMFEVARCIKFNSPTVVRSCALRIDEEQIEISITGACRFDLSFSHFPDRVLVNKSSFDLAPGSRSARFALDGSGWKLIAEEHI